MASDPLQAIIELIKQFDAQHKEEIANLKSRIVQLESGSQDAQYKALRDDHFALLVDYNNLNERYEKVLEENKLLRTKLDKIAKDVTHICNNV